MLNVQPLLGGLSFDLGHIVPDSTIDCDTARLHRLGDFPPQFDGEQPVFEPGALDLDVIGQRELAFEAARRDAAMQEGLAFFLVLAAFEREHVMLRSESDLFRQKTGERDRNLESVFVETFDITGGYVSSAVRWTSSRTSKRRSKPMVDLQRGVQSYLISKSSLEQDGYEQAPDTAAGDASKIWQAEKSFKGSRHIF